MSAADALATWRERAESELAGVPLRSLEPRRPDGLSIPPLEVADPTREQGLGSQPTRRKIALVVGAGALEVALPFLEGVDVLWLRASRAPVATVTATVVVEPTESGFDRASLGELLVLTDAATEAAVDGSTRPWDPRDAISSAAAHERGAGAVLEVAFAVAAMLDRRRALGTARPPAFATAVSPEIFVEVSKLRALRRLSDRVLATLGEAVGVPIYARTDDRSHARLDRATNGIRATLGASAAMIGGADCVGATAMDALEAHPSTLGARLSRNTSLVLSLESSLLATDDPARGSYFVEALTDRIARDAWELVREIERRGGLSRAAEWARARLGADAAARLAAVRSRSVPLVGVSRFAVPDETLATGATELRDASSFEALHEGSPPGVALVILGERSAVEARAAFARELLGAGAMRATEATGAAEVTDLVALIAAPDALFGSDVLAHVVALTARGVDVWIAGRPAAHESALRTAGARGFVFVGADVVDALTEMRARAARGT